MVNGTERDRPIITNLQPARLGLRERQVVRLRVGMTADQAGMRGYVAQVAGATEACGFREEH